MRYWLMKSEPTDFSINDLEKHLIKVLIGMVLETTKHVTL